MGMDSNEFVEIRNNQAENVFMIKLARFKKAIFEAAGIR